MGEDRPTTIIDGGMTGNVVSILADTVQIMGFTIQFSGYYKSGVEVSGSQCEIANDTFREDFFGVWVNSNLTSIHDNIFGDNNDSVTISYFSNCNRIFSNSIYSSIHAIMLLGLGNNVSENLMSSNRWGILVSGDMNTIYHNTITPCENTGLEIAATKTAVIGNTVELADTGIEVGSEASDLLVKSNNVSQCNYGIYLWGITANAALVTENSFTDSLFGTWVYQCTGVNISKNNFRDNTVNAEFRTLPKLRNIWAENYWDDGHGRLPYRIYGKNRVFSFDHGYFHFEINLPWMNVDWHPATTPYNFS